MTNAARPVAVLLAGLALACAGGGSPAARSCEADDECDGGVCFQARCYTACEGQDGCAPDELCVRLEDGDEPAVVCVAAAEYAACDDDGDCAAVVVGACEGATCDGTVCAVKALSDVGCTTAGGTAGTCRDGACEASGACSDGNAVDWDGCRDGVRVERSVPVDPSTDGRRPAVAGTPDGGYAVAWHAPGPDGELQRVRARTFGPDGAGGAEWAINAEADPFALDVALAPGGSADLVAVWDASMGSETLRARLFGADGTPASAEVAALDEAAQPFSALDRDLAGRAGQGFVLAWAGWDDATPMTSGLMLARYDAAAAAQGAPVVARAEEGLAYTSPRLGMAADGAFWLVCQEYALGEWSRLSVLRFSATGERTLGPVTFGQVATAGAPSQDPDVAPTADGGALVVHDLAAGDAIVAVRVGADGQAAGEPLTVATAPADASLERPHVVVVGTDRMLAVWKRHGPGDAGGIDGRVLDGTGAAVGEVRELSGGLAGSYGEPAAAALEGGGAALAWEHCPPGEDAEPSYDGTGCSLLTLRVDAAGQAF